MTRGYERALLTFAWMALSASTALTPALAADKKPLTGTVSDSMCGTQHMTGSPTECTRSCVGHGAKYLLVVGDKTYGLNTPDKALLAVLDQQAGKSATVIGSVNGVAVDVSSVVAAK